MPRFTNVLLKLVFVIHKNKEAYSEPLFVKIVDHGWELAKFGKSSILHV